MNIIELAKKAGFYTPAITEERLEILQAFAALLREEFKEEAAKMCEQSDRYRGDYFAAKIREMK